MKNTFVCVTFRKQRDHRISDLLEIVKHDFKIPVLEVRANIYIDVARSLLSCRALEQGADVTLFIDDDMIFDPHDIEPLAESARATRGIVGAAYSQRKPAGGVVGAFDAPSSGPATFFDGGGLLPVSSGPLGMGFTAIHRDVYTKIDLLLEYQTVQSDEGPMRPYFQKLITDEGYWLKEDGSFCHTARETGSSLHVDSRIRVFHVGEYDYALEDCQWQVPRLPSLQLSLKKP